MQVHRYIVTIEDRGGSGAVVATAELSHVIDVHFGAPAHVQYIDTEDS